MGHLTTLPLPLLLARLVMGALVVGLAGCQELPRTYSTRTQHGQEVFRDDFEHGELGPNWHPTGPGARIENGRLKLANLRNHPVWLDVPLPRDSRIAFDAWARSDEGDIKVELYGDGRSFATRPSYVASGYVVIFGGWNNRLSVIARRNEHGRSRESRSDLEVEADRRHRFVITRTGGELYWEIDGEEILVMQDEDPLYGPDNDRFAFSGWEAPVDFDNLVIEAL